MRRLSWLMLMLLLAGCAPITPRPFVSPLAVPLAAQTRVYVPYAPGAVNKLGLAGGNPTWTRTFGAAIYHAWTVDLVSSTTALAVPMVWGRYGRVPDLPAWTSYAIMFNEPDRSDQAHMTPGEAAVLAHQLFAVYPDVQWGAPVTSPLHPEWLDQFFATYQCLYGQYPPVAFLTAHCNQPGRVEDCEAVVSGLHAKALKWGVPGGEVWLTELSLTTQAEVNALLPWLDRQPWLTHYFVFISHMDCRDLSFWNCARDGNPSLFNLDGTLTERGKWYQRSWLWTATVGD